MTRLTLDQQKEITFDLFAASTAKHYHWRARFQAEHCQVFLWDEAAVQNRIHFLWEKVSQSIERSYEECELAVLLAGFPHLALSSPNGHPWIASLVRRLRALR